MMRKIDINCLLQMDENIRHRSTGTPSDFAQRVGLSRSSLFEYLTLMRQDFGLSIEYNRYSQTYYYEGIDLIESFNRRKCIK
jgi:hypothetical protein